MAERIETDSMGPISVPAEHYWGAQTQRSLIHFNIGDDLIPREVIRGFAVLKKACALANRGLGKLDPAPADAICSACDEILKESDQLLPDKERHAAYEPYFDLYQKLYPALKESFHTLAKLS